MVAQRSGGADDVDASVAWHYVQAKILSRLGAAEDAESLARHGLALLAGTDALSRQGDVLAVLADILRLTGRSGDANTYLHSAIQLYEEKGNVVAAARARAILPEFAVPT